MADITVPPTNVTIARKIQFSAAHLYHQACWSRQKNQQVFGACFTEYGHGHNYDLEVFVAGRVNSKNKMVMNVTELDGIMKKVVEPMEHHHINFDIPDFDHRLPGRSLVPTTEVLALWIRERLLRELKTWRLKLDRLRLYENEDIRVELEERAKKVPRFLVCQEVEIRAQHHIYNQDLSPKENAKLLGICARPHGHHYKIQVWLGAKDLDRDSQMVVDRDRLITVLDERVVAIFDGRDLNQIFPNTACEALAFEFYQYLAPIMKLEFPKVKLVKLGIQETTKNYFEFAP